MQTIKRESLGPIKSASVPNRVINTDGYIYEYVGIGWIKQGKATKEDFNNIPKISS